MDLAFDAFQLAEVVLGIPTPTLPFALLGVGAAFVIGAAVWRKPRRAVAQRPDAQPSRPAPEKKLVA